MSSFSWITFLTKNPIENFLCMILGAKLACLILLATMRCSIDLSQLDLTYLTWIPDKTGCTFYLPHPTKTYTTRTGKKTAKLLQNIELKELPFDKFSPQSDLKMCPVQCLIEYMRHTATLRIDHSKLFIINNEPFSPCKQTTICTWVKTVMSRAGINIGNYAAHSFQSATSSKAFWVGINIGTIMRKAGWRTRNVFINHYLKRVKGHTPTVEKDEDSVTPSLPPSIDNMGCRWERRLKLNKLKLKRPGSLQLFGEISLPWTRFPLLGGDPFWGSCL